MNATIIFVIGLIAGAIITEIVNIFFTPIKSWVGTEKEEFCSFYIKGTNNYAEGTIKVSKRFNKITSINCGWFNDRKEIEFNGIKYLHCGFGQKPPNSGLYHGGFCPFDTESKKLFVK